MLRFARLVTGRALYQERAARFRLHFDSVAFRCYPTKAEMGITLIAFDLDFIRISVGLYSDFNRKLDFL